MVVAVGCFSAKGTEALKSDWNSSETKVVTLNKQPHVKYGLYYLFNYPKYMWKPRRDVNEM